MLNGHDLFPVSMLVNMSSPSFFDVVATESNQGRRNLDDENLSCASTWFEGKKCWIELDYFDFTRLIFPTWSRNRTFWDVSSKESRIFWTNKSMTLYCLNHHRDFLQALLQVLNEHDLFLSSTLLSESLQTHQPPASGF